jgi:hypothetical protein
LGEGQSVIPKGDKNNQREIRPPRINVNLGGGVGKLRGRRGFGFASTTGMGQGFEISIRIAAQRSATCTLLRCLAMRLSVSSGMPWNCDSPEIVPTTSVLIRKGTWLTHFLVGCIGFHLCSTNPQAQISKKTEINLAQ